MPESTALKTPAPLIARGSPAAAGVAIGLAIVLLGLFGLLHNPYWVRHGDSELFLSLARNLATGQGYQFNGQPVAIAPPLWPALLAGVMKFSTSLLVLKMLPILSMVGFLMLSYFILLRWTTPIIAVLCVLTAAILEPVFSLTYLFFSDSLFALLVMAAVWTALRISEGEDSWGWIAALVVLCVLSISTRWAGLPFFAVIGAAVLHGEVLPRLNRRWLAFGLSAAATVIVFLGLRALLKVDESQIDPRYDRFVAGHYSMLSQTSLDDTVTNRIGHFGEWVGGLLWRPAQMYRFSRILDNLAGWGVSLLAGGMVIVAMRRRHWVWLGGAVYLIVLGINWPDPMSRYIVPLTPFILFGAYHSITRLFAPMKLDWPRLLILNLFFASILMVNAGLYAMNLAVLRSRNFYQAWQGGVHKELIDAATYIRNQPRGDYEVAISGKTVNFGREFPETDGFRRALNFLTARNIVTMPFNLCREPNPEVIQWLTEHKVRYYLYQPPIRVVEHFRPRSTIEGAPLAPDDGAWRMYEIRDGEAIRVALDPTSDWPRNVPWRE